MKIKDLGKKLGIAALSGLLSLGALEIGLRLTQPKIGELVNNPQITNTYKIFENPTNHTREIIHPDTGEPHRVTHNSLGNRQHREFETPKPKEVTRIGFFGDSFTENLGMEVQYSYTEALDFLLNQTGHPYEVLNFGVEGYGTDQSFLRYKGDAKDLVLDAVSYMYCINDISDIARNNLFQISNGEISYTPVHKISPLVELARRLYLTYFVLSFGGSPDYSVIGEKVEHEQRKDFLRTKDKSKLEKEATQVFEYLVRSMAQEAKKRDQYFFTGLVSVKEDSVYPNHANIKSILSSHEIDIIDLVEELDKTGERQMLHFLNDNGGHWNEMGTLYTAEALYLHLCQQDLGIDPRLCTPEFARGQLQLYTSIFPSDQLWTPFNEYTQVPKEKQEKIRKRYLAL